MGGAEERYAFVHALLRDIVYDGMLVRSRKRWHARLAEVLEADPTLLPRGRA